jgi:hypothetical protein
VADCIAGGRISVLLERGFVIRPDAEIGDIALDLHPGENPVRVAVIVRAWGRHLGDDYVDSPSALERAAAWPAEGFGNGFGSRNLRRTFSLIREISLR